MRRQPFGPQVAPFLAVVLAGVAVGGCKKNSDGGDTNYVLGKIKITDKARSEAQKIYATRCQTCHGADGAGQGPAAAALNPKPRDYREASWQASVSDEEIAKIIVGGGPAVGKSALMPPNPDLRDKQAVVAALVEKIRNFETTK